MPSPLNIATNYTTFTSNHADPFIINQEEILVHKKSQKKLESKIPEIFTPKKGFTFGCDPEGVLFDKVTNTPVPAAGIIKGTKYAPHPVDKGAIQVDGMAVEFNIDPASTYEEWEGNITTVVAQLEEAIPDDLEIRWIPSVKFTEDAFDKAPDEAKALGCQPDFNGWTGQVNLPPNYEDPYVRCFGGHLHIGFPDTTNEDTNNLQHVMNCQDLVQQFDWFLGGWSVLQDKDLLRRQLYGKMGACRYKPYGVEYRVLSNFWVPSKELRLEVWNRMCAGIEQINGFFIPERTHSSVTDWLETAINKGEVLPDLMRFGEYPLVTLNPNLSQF